MNIGLILAILLPFLGSIFSRNIINTNITSWYALLRKPTWNPPKWLIRPVWSAIYVLIGYASYLVYQERGHTMALVMYGVQLLLVWSLSPIFFGLHNLRLASYTSLALWMAVLGCCCSFYLLSTMAWMLFLPYLAWITFATILSIKIWQLNGDTPEFSQNQKQ